MWKRVTVFYVTLHWQEENRFVQWLFWFSWHNEYFCLHYSTQHWFLYNINEAVDHLDPKFWSRSKVVKRPGVFVLFCFYATSLWRQLIRLYQHMYYCQGKCFSKFRNITTPARSIEKIIYVEIGLVLVLWIGCPNPDKMWSRVYWRKSFLCLFILFINYVLDPVLVQKIFMLFTQSIIYTLDG